MGRSPEGRHGTRVALDLKDPRAIDAVLRLIEQSDVFIEGFRPGVVERLGLGPEVCLARNPALVYGRVTGWGREGPYALVAGHDLNYLALTGALHSIGAANGPPAVPLNLVADFGGGGMYLAVGVVSALLAALVTGEGRVVDAAMIDGVAAMMAMFHPLIANGSWSERRGTNVLDGGAHFYNVYETADGCHVSVAAIEPPFYRALLTGLGLDGEDLPAQLDRAAWPAMRERFATIFRTRTRDEWCAVLEHTDACFAPVLTPTEALDHPHHLARGTFLDVEGVQRLGGGSSGEPPVPGEHTAQVLAEAGLTQAEIQALTTL
ncbi:CaiB/BaiF CoA transferase family protein [Nonomuraea sp. 10N515B]|uniref:CaiB/BaiF CoA transferase family protein n=1 Tax=Nonomuraea sp. 10N515B TaxID=3457422 RepID=UPI003FCCBDDE